MKDLACLALDVLDVETLAAQLLGKAGIDACKPLEDVVPLLESGDWATSTVLARVGMQAVRADRGDGIGGLWCQRTRAARANLGLIKGECILPRPIEILVDLIEERVLVGETISLGRGIQGGREVGNELLWGRKGHNRSETV